MLGYLSTARKDWPCFMSPNSGHAGFCERLIESSAKDDDCFATVFFHRLTQGSLRLHDLLIRYYPDSASIFVSQHCDIFKDKV